MSTALARFGIRENNDPNDPDEKIRAARFWKCNAADIAEVQAQLDYEKNVKKQAYFSDIIYNATTDKFQFYQGGHWIELQSGTAGKTTTYAVTTADFSLRSDGMYEAKITAAQHGLPATQFIHAVFQQKVAPGKKHDQTSGSPDEYEINMNDAHTDANGLISLVMTQPSAGNLLLTSFS